MYSGDCSRGTIAVLCYSDGGQDINRVGAIVGRKRMRQEGE